MLELNSKDISEVEIDLALRVVDKELHAQVMKGFGVLTVAFHIQNGRIALIKKTQEDTMKFGD